MGRIIGIDLGTTNSVAAYWNRRRPKPIMNSDNSSLTLLWLPLNKVFAT